MVRQIIEQIERLHAAGAIVRDAPHSELTEKALARCLQQLRGIVALDARDKVARRPALRIV